MSKDFTDISDKLKTWQSPESLNALAKLDFATMQVRWKEIGDAAKEYVSRAFMVIVDT
jgi:hypothetical protein